MDVPIRRVAFFAFEGMTLLDLVGAYDVLRRVASMGVDPAVTTSIIGAADQLTDDAGLMLRTHAVYPDLAAFDLLVVPGGPITRRLVDDPTVIGYLRAWPRGRPLASVCTGSLLIGSAGHLAGLRATTHHTAYDLLAPYCREVVRDARVVDEGAVVTAGGVTCALDLGLHLVARHWGQDARTRIARQIDWPSG